MMFSNLCPIYVKKGLSNDENHNYKYVLADSRAVFDPGETVFAAIRTSVGDGHRYIPELASRGVKAFIVEEIPPSCYNIDATFYVVDSVPKALIRMAYGRIRGFRNLIIVTGSIGKTVTKELIYNSLAKSCIVSRSPRSWNSRIGAPLAVLDILSPGFNRPDAVVLELGIDGPGQATERLEMLPKEPQIGVVTPITDEHDSSFASHRDKILEKVRLLSLCRDIFYCADDVELENILKENLKAKLHPVLRGNHPTIYHALASSVTEFLGYDTTMVDGLPLVDKRCEIFDGGFGNTVFHDHFTPDVRSLREALDFFRRHSAADRPHVLVLGDLLTPGKNPTVGDIAIEYRKAFELARKFGVEKIYCLSSDVAEFGQYMSVPDFVEVCGPIMPMTMAAYQNGTLIRNSQILLFGSCGGALDEFADLSMTAGHDTSLEVDLDALTHNFNYYRSLLPKHTGIIAMVKASAYGLGAVEIAKTLQSAGAAYLAVAVIDEGIALREAGITMPIMVLNPITNRYPLLFANRLEPAVFSPDELVRLIVEAEKYGTEAYPIHIKFDTGMHRVGFLSEQIEGIAESLGNTDAVTVRSVFSHLATADCLDMDEYTLGQLRLFYKMADSLSEAVGIPVKRHILNTAGMMRFSRNGRYDMARLGIGLYGITPYPVEGVSPLRAVATLRTHIISLKQWPVGTPIGYGCRGKVERDSIVATIPVGYADGINRHLGRGHASFIVKGVECPTIGNICMDLCMIDVTDVKDVKVGDSVEIFGTEAPVERLAEILDTIPYEILTSVSPRVKRIYYRKN